MKKTPKYLSKLPLFLTAALLTLASCKDDITLPDADNGPKIVVYSFPCPARDTTYIFVSRSLPVQQYHNNMPMKVIDDARITYAINGQACVVSHRGGGYYYVLAPHHAGDHVSISVSADSLPDATAETTVPDTVAVSDIGYREVHIYDDDYGAMQYYDQFTAIFTDPTATRDYYAVRVRENTTRSFAIFDDDGRQTGDSTIDVRYYPDIVTKSEPLLKPMSNIDTFFGFDNYFYGGLAIFDDSDLDGKPYTLHLNVEETNYRYNQSYQMELLHLSPEYYRFLESVNAVENNDMAKYGLSQIMPTATNVHGGFGLVAGWNVATTAPIRRSNE